MARFALSVVGVIALGIAAFAAYGTVWTLFLSVALGIVVREAYQSGKDLVDQGRQSYAGDYETLTSGSQPRGNEQADAQGKFSRSLHLDQRGKQVTGTEIGGGDFRWRITGDITGGFIIGGWAQESPRDESIRGTYQLKQDPQNRNRLYGVWMGWDPVALKLSNGTYEWVRK